MQQAQQQQQFTPEQLLVAARRAEQQGQAAYALQFYRYLAEQYPQSAEGAEAHDALYRLQPPEEAPRPVAQPRPPATQQVAQQMQPAPLGDLRPQQPVAQQQVPTQRRPQAVPPPPQATAAPAVDARARGRRTTPAQRHQDEVEIPAAAQSRRRGYRLGRFVAAVLGMVGWMFLLGSVVAGAGVVVAMVVKSVPKGLRDVVVGNLPLVGGGTAALLVIGLFAVFAAQVARATFDNADTTRYILDGLLAGRDQDE